MDKLLEITKKSLEFMGFSDWSADSESDSRRITVFINEGEWIKTWIPRLISDFETILRLVAKKDGTDSVFVDINNYRKERERLILEIAKAAAKKAVLTKGPISLPAMNAYERRLVHAELSTRPDVKTESVGEGSSRYVVIRPI
jgi:spoIIIJ-associated protein